MVSALKYERLINLEVINRKSVFLFGPRQTGKSTLLKELFGHCYYVNLLESDQFGLVADDSPPVSLTALC